MKQKGHKLESGRLIKVEISKLLRLTTDQAGPCQAVLPTVVNDQSLPQSIWSGQMSNSSSQSSNAEKICKCTFAIFYLHISKMLKLFEIKGQGKAQYGNFQTPSPINLQET